MPSFFYFGNKMIGRKHEAVARVTLLIEREHLSLVPSRRPRQMASQNYVSTRERNNSR